MNESRPPDMPFWKWCLLMEDLRMIDAIQHMNEICPPTGPVRIIVSTPAGHSNKFLELCKKREYYQQFIKQPIIKQEDNQPMKWYWPKEDE